MSDDDDDDYGYETKQKSPGVKRSDKIFNCVNVTYIFDWEEMQKIGKTFRLYNNQIGPTIEYCFPTASCVEQDIIESILDSSADTHPVFAFEQTEQPPSKFYYFQPSSDPKMEMELEMSHRWCERIDEAVTNFGWMGLPVEERIEEIQKIILLS
jgi:hypothetical protein